MAKTHQYVGDRIKVFYEVGRCIHAAECVHGLKDVFDPDRRPWVDPDGADPDEIASVISTCPTGALRYERTDGGPAEARPAKNTITLVADGPVYVRGDLEVEDPGGRADAASTRIALCRCGASQNKPYCDNSHIRIGFTTDLG